MKEWFSAAWLADQNAPGCAGTKSGVIRQAKRERWNAPDRQLGFHPEPYWRRREGKGGGIEYHARVLPAKVRAALAATSIVDAIPANARPMDASERPPMSVERTERWRQFDARPQHQKDQAYKRVNVLDYVERELDLGNTRVAAINAASEKYRVSQSTIRNWRALVDGAERHDWPAYLIPRHVGSTGRQADLHEEAWDWIRAQWLRLEQPTFESSWRALERVAAKEGWHLPSKKTVQRRLKALPPSTRVLGRQGVEALKRLYPAQERDRSHFHALQAVNADGHKWDVFVRWPDGHIGRPMMVAFQDLYSGKILSWRIDRSEHAGLVRLALGDMITTFGVPDECWLDNGRGFAAKWLTGGTPTRYRFKVREEDADGVLTTLGVKVHWTTPYSGQSKPIERAFRDFCSDIAKDPRFAGAYTGNTPLAKPENYGHSAVPIDTFVQVVTEGITLHNARQGRRSAVANGRSFDDVFTASYRQSPVRRATEEQRRLWLLAAEGRRARRDGSIELLGNRYWTEELVNHAQQKLVVRFDPQDLHGDVHVYRLDGSYICSAPVIEAVGFADTDAARAHSQARAKWMRSQKDMLAAEKVIGMDQVAAMLPSVDETPAPPPSTVVRPIFGNTALAPQPIEDIEPEEDRPMAGIRNFLSLVRTHENGADGD